MEKALIALGLTETEAKVYIALLKRGNSLAGKITKETGLHRRTVYDTIERLIEKGLVSYIETNNKKHFEAVNPERLVDMLKEKESILLSQLNQLKELYKTTKEKKETLFFRGKQSLKYVFDDQIKEGKEILFMGKLLQVEEILKFYFAKYDAQRIEKKINIKMLFDIESKGLFKNIPLSEVRCLSNWNSSTMSTYIYGNNVSLVIWDNEPVAILIRQKEVAEGFRNYFNMLWQIAKK